MAGSQALPIRTFADRVPFGTVLHFSGRYLALSFCRVAGKTSLSTPIFGVERGKVAGKGLPLCPRVTAAVLFQPIRKFWRPQNKKTVGSGSGTIRRDPWDCGIRLRTATGNETGRAKVDGHQGHRESERRQDTFVSDDGEKSCEAVNPETLKDHVGHHVELSAHVYADKVRSI
jgi:hypothetical protein